MLLRDCLTAQSLRHLEAIHRARGLAFDTHLPKSLVIEQLTERLREPETTRAAWHALSAEARAALTALLEAGGHLPREDFIYRFGAVRPYRPWQPGDPRAPWESPQSPAEEIVFQGLAFLVNLGTTQRPAWAAVLPNECRAPLSALTSSLSSPVLRPSSLSASLSPLPAGLFAFLSFLHRRDIRPIWGRWLPPTALREVNRYLDRPCDLTGVRSERDAPYLAFLHYLAERAGLVELAAGCLKPALVAHEWLAASPREQLERLWAAWTGDDAANRDLWQRYRLPGYKVEGVTRRFRRLLDHLARRVPGLGQPTGDFVDRLAEAEPLLFRAESYAHWTALSKETRARFHDRVRAALAALLDGPLAWFGLLDGEPPALTPLGAAILGREDGRWPEDPPPAPLIVSPRLVETEDDGEPAIRLTAPPALPLPARLALESLVPPDPGRPGVYLLTRTALLQALQRGHTAGGVANSLEGAARAPLPPAVAGAIYCWAEAHQQLAVRQLLLLEARDPALLQTLTRQRRIRETLGETLSARAVRVQADRLPALLRRLARRGHYPHLDLAGGSLSPEGEKKDAGERALIAVALRVYAELADELSLPVRPLHALARAWTEDLSLPQRDAAERLIVETLDRLRRAALPEGDYRLPSPAGPLLAALEKAIAGGATVEMRYYTAGRDHETTRRVDPLRLEWRGRVAYLVAHCHLRGEQRIFRVDRIAELRQL